MAAFLMGVDVGTGSARAGLFDAEGRRLARAEHPIRIHTPEPDFVEQSSDDIWDAVGLAARECVRQAGIAPEEVRGLAFDATCSTVCLDRNGRPVTVSRTADNAWDVIVWMDHRATAEADACNATGHRVLDYVGGSISPEMAVPKLLWLKQNLPGSWARLGLLFDLADFLGWRATGNPARSACTVTCKWTYLAHEKSGWQPDFLAAAGVPDLIERGALPARAAEIGDDLGPLTPDAARHLGLTTACRVGAGLIDAHAGALGVLGGRAGGGSVELDRRLALIAGTSSCHMALSREPRSVQGVWGPYFGAVLPGWWLNEGGQSATGALLDHIIALHSAGAELGSRPHDAILARIAQLRERDGDDFARGLHVLPDFHGNRSPLADPHAAGVISGLTLDRSVDALCRLYYRTAVAIALGTRHILDALRSKGYAIDRLHVTGGHTKNPLLMELYADATGCEVIASSEDDAVLLGDAIVAARAAGLHPDLASAAAAMAREGEVRRPDQARQAGFERDYRGFLLMHEQRRALLAAAGHGASV
jgi:FGGY-family pentulose kinase